jgi:hypothetical protein
MNGLRQQPTLLQRAGQNELAAVLLLGCETAHWLLCVNLLD